VYSAATSVAAALFPSAVVIEPAKLF